MNFATTLGGDSRITSWRKRAAPIGRNQPLLGLAGALAVSLAFSHLLGSLFPAAWGIVPALIAALLWNFEPHECEKPTVAFWQMTASLSAVVALLSYPLMAIAPNLPNAKIAYALLLAAWVTAVCCGFLCYLKPSLAVVPSAFLVWSRHFAVHITGLDFSRITDIRSLCDIGICVGLGFLILRYFRATHARHVSPHAAAAGDAFGVLLLPIAITAHFSNYFWSFMAKNFRDAPPLTWLLHNDTSNIFLGALQVHHFALSNSPVTIGALYHLLHNTYLITNAAILLAQGLAIVAIFLPKRALLALLAAYDAMHLGILLAGANFWPWMLLNVLIGIAVASNRVAVTTAIQRMIIVAFTLAGPLVFHATGLGWFDSGANNHVFIEAVDKSGTIYPVSTNIFAFYSYPIAHMDYGVPGFKAAFVTSNPVGGTYNYADFVAGRTCDAAHLERNNGGVPRTLSQMLSPRDPKPLDPHLLRYLVNFNVLAIKLQEKLGWFPYKFNLYHHYVPAAFGADFDRLDKRDVVAYLVKRESVCLSFEDGALKQRVISSAQVRVNLN